MALLERFSSDNSTGWPSRRLYGEGSCPNIGCALLQVGMDYWRNPTIGYGSGGNNHEAGASRWYFPSDNWQEAAFTDIKP